MKATTRAVSSRLTFPGSHRRAALYLDGGRAHGGLFFLGPFLLLAALTAIGFVTRPPTPIDETRYLGVAWEMWLRHDYFLLFKNGMPYSDKPPLLFWLINLGWSAFGVTEWWPRLIAPLFSLGSLLLTAALARRLWPQDACVRRQAAWILSSCLLWILFSTSMMFDVLLAFFTLLGLCGVLMAAHGSLRRGFAWLALAIGLGVLAKGPVILLHVLPVAVLAPWWQPGLAWRRWYGGLLLAVLAGAGLALAWAIPAALKGGEEYRQMIFWGQTAGRLANSFAHKRAFWWYLPLLPLLFYPWLVWPTLWRRIVSIKREGLDVGLRFCLAWLLPVLLAFSLISGKQVHYLVPLMPAVALLAARLLTRAPGGGFGSVALLALALGAALFWLSLNPDRFALPSGIGVLPHWPGLALAMGALVLWGLGRRNDRRLPLMAILGALTVAMLEFQAAGYFWTRYDIRPIAAEIRRLQDRGIPLANRGMYHAQYQFAGRLTKPIDQIQPESALQDWFTRHPQGVVIAYLDPRSPDLRRNALFVQPYLDEYALLLNARQARAHGLIR